MNDESVIRARLIHLLDYVSQQSKDVDINQYIIHQPAITLSDLQQAAGAKLASADQPVWFEITRLKRLEPPTIANAIQPYLQCEPPTKTLPSNTSRVEPQAPTRQDLFVPYVASPVQILPSNGLGFVAAMQQITQRQQQISQYLADWAAWQQESQRVNHSIDLYDLLFEWKTDLAMSQGNAPAELVAGMGMMAWQLPSTGESYVYPLVTQQIDINILSNGVIQVMALDAKPQLEVAAFMLQDALPQAASLKKQLKEQLDDGRDIHLFDPDSYQDLVHAAVVSLDSQGSVLPLDQALPTPNAQLRANLSWSIFSRPRMSSVVDDDIEQLKATLDDGATIFEQAKTLVQDPSTLARTERAVAFRGRAGIEGTPTDSSPAQELFFPLPYNTEQVTIVQQLARQAGVVVQGPPGTGKTHTIANIICHYLAHGKRVLVTAQQGHVLKTVQEKIPTSIRPLVVSRVGTSTDSRRQLASSIDVIVQTLSQLNVSEVQENIANTLQRIERTHHNMGTLDRQMFDFAEAQYTDIDIDGQPQRASDVADWVLASSTAYAWFSDVLSLAPQHQFPLRTEQLNALRQARREVGHYLSQGCAALPDSRELPSATVVGELHQAQQRVSEVNALHDAGEQWRAAAGVADADFVAVRDMLADALQQHQQLAAAQQDAVWLAAFRQKLHDDRLNVEIAALKQLMPDMQAFIALRSVFLDQPVDIPAAFYTEPKAEGALQRAVETGKPLQWFHFASAALVEVFAHIRVMGEVAEQTAQWQHVQRYVDTVAQAKQFCSRWQRIAPTLSLPELSVDPTQLADFLRTVDLNHRVIEQSMQLFEHEVHLAQHCSRLWLAHDQPLGSAVFYDVVDHVQQVLTQVNAHLDFQQLADAVQRLHQLRQYCDSFSHPLAQQLQQCLSQLGDAQALSHVTAQYQRYVDELQQLERLVPYFDCINNAVVQLRQAGAVQLSHDVAQIAHAGGTDDHVLPSNLLEAWRWARLKQYLTDIDHREQLIALSQQRHDLEQVLASAYEELAAQQAWLSLKQSASDHVLTALQSYKTAVQKLGKGTGKNAVRYRKDAQRAMLQAADAIPCWVMTHYQVSESMPSQLGIFDLIVVDEASQSTIEALPVLMRGKKLLVVGDDKQVSPSNVGLSSEHIGLLRQKFLLDQPHAAVLTPDMSLYDIASSIYPSTVMLLEHFRSHPAIIEYSNQQFYAGKIKPMRVSKQSERLSPALVAIYTPEGMREDKARHKINRVEAAAILAEMELLLSDARYDGRSIGVISLLGHDQSAYIQTQALDRFGAEQLTQRQFACGDASAFQGAERDIIFLSMVADPTQCYPLSRRDHEQRLNVAASRARERMYLVHSVKLEHLSGKDLRTALLAHFYQHKVMTEAPTRVQKLALCESGFEKEVLTALLDLGYHVTPQLKVGGYRLDLVVEGEQDTRLAIECDGDSYHGPEQWSSDIKRQRTLERAGWVFWRCFASTWRLEKQVVLDDLLATLGNMNIQPTHGSHLDNVEAETREWIAPPVETAPQDTAVNASAAVQVKQCRQCHLEKASSQFVDNSYYADGLSAWCESCLLSIYKTCAFCDERKTALEFVQNIKRVDGLAKFCKVCTDQLLRG